MISLWDSREEGVALRPFNQVAEIEKHLATKIALHVESSMGTDQVEPLGWLGLPKSEIGKLGLTLEIFDIDEMRRLVNKAVISLDNVDYLVVAMDRPNSVTRETAVLERGPISELSKNLTLNVKGSSPINRILENQASGFEIELALVLNKDEEGFNPVSPRTKGALVAKTSFGVRPAADADSFQPEPLTEEIRERLNLPKSTWAYVETLPGLLTAPSLRESARYYVQEEILNSVRFLTGPGGRLAEELLLTHFITGLIYEISLALREVDAPSDEDFVSSQLFFLLTKRFPRLEEADLIVWLRDQPDKVLAAWQGDPKNTRELLAVFANLSGDQDDLSDS